MRSQRFRLLMNRKKLGPELVTNGTFDVNTAGWTPRQLGVLSVVTGRLRITNDAVTASNGYAFQTIAGIEIGATYYYKMSSFVGSATVPQMLLGVGELGAEYVNTGGVPGTFEGSFVATGATISFTMLNNDNAISRFAEYDNFSIKKFS